jgi:hypothetical protein
LIHRKWHSSELDILSFREADCETGHNLVAAEVMVGIPVSKQTAQKFDVERCRVKKLHDV